MGVIAVEIRAMELDDYEQAFALWNATLTAPMSEDDTRESIARFLRRNPGLSAVAVHEGAVAGSILCGHDGRRGFFYHVAVAEQWRKHGVGKAMVQYCLAALHAEGIRKCALVAFTQNHTGNAFWAQMGFAHRDDLLYRDNTTGDFS